MSASDGTIVILQRDPEELRRFRDSRIPHSLHTRLCSSTADAVAALGEGGARALVTDLEPSDHEVLALVGAARALSPPAQVVVLTAAPLAVRAVLRSHAIPAEVLRRPARVRDVLARVSCGQRLTDEEVDV